MLAGQMFLLGGYAALVGAIQGGIACLLLDCCSVRAPVSLSTWEPFVTAWDRLQDALGCRASCLVAMVSVQAKCMLEAEF